MRDAIYFLRSTSLGVNCQEPADQPSSLPSSEGARDRREHHDRCEYWSQPEAPLLPARTSEAGILRDRPLSHRDRLN
jgi:hypothetical protein